MYPIVNNYLVNTFKGSRVSIVKNNRVSMSKPIPVKLDPALLARIKEVSERMGEAQSTVMRIAMRVGLEGLEKLFREVSLTDKGKKASSLSADTVRTLLEAFDADTARGRAARSKAKQ
jgi:predicted DNA-binding protein